MTDTYWHKQTSGKPLYPDLIWSRPQTKRQGGKLLIIGGNAHGFAAAGEAYAEAVRAGIGTARVVLPDSLQKTVGKVLEAGEYAPSTPSGSFARRALAELLTMAEWADGVLLAGDFGRNSETAVMLEKFVSDYDGRLTLTKDAADYFLNSPRKLLDRDGTLLVLSFAQLQKMATKARFLPALTFEMDLLHLVDALHELSLRHKAAIMVKHLQMIFAASGGQVSSTKLDEDMDIWRVRTAAQAAVWWLQNPAKPFEAITSALVNSLSTPDV